MDTSTINELKTRASQVRNATVEGENTAVRVGQLMYDMIDYDYNQSVAITNLEAKTDKLQDQIDQLDPGGGGGGGGSAAGYQKMYFANVPKNTQVNAPSASDYSPSEDAFTTSTPQWVRTNVNPTENEYTYAIWVYFNGHDEIVTIDGPVRLNGGGTGTNGEDGEETEWIYMRRASELSSGDMAIIQNKLEGYVGTAQAKYWNGSQWISCTFQHEDAVPTEDDWTDNAQGIDDSQNKYEYAAFRVSKNGADGKRAWGEDCFHGPLLWAAYGKQGTDGDGVEYIFYADPDGRIDGPNNHPEEWTNDPNFQNTEYIREGSDWMDEPIDLEEAGYGQGSVEFVSMRKMQNGVWQAYSEPKPWTRYAKDGIVDGYTVDLSNENMPVGTDDQGSASGYTNQCLIQAFYNGTPLNYAAQASEGYFTYSIGTITRSDGRTVGNTITATKSNANINVAVSNISNFANINAYIPITVTLPNNSTRQLNITLYGVATGEAGAAIDLVAGCNVVRVNSGKTVATPSKIRPAVKIAKGDNVQLYYSHSIQEGDAGSAEEKGYTFKYAYDDSSTQSSRGEITINPAFSNIRLQMYYNGSLIDEETVPYVADGANGDAGRGISSIEAHYKAFASEEGSHSITQNDPTDPANVTNWNSTNKYLYRRDYIYYTNGDKGWASSDGYLYQVYLEAPAGGDGYTLLVSPSYAIFDEPLGEAVVNPTTQVVTYPAGKIDTSSWSAKVQILNGKNPMRIGYSNNGFTHPICNCTIGWDISSGSADNTTLIVTIPMGQGGSSGITDTTATEGKISFWTTENPGNTVNSGTAFIKVEIPIYINRLGSRLMTIAGDVERTMMSKSAYSDATGTIKRFDTLGDYIRSSEANISTLTTSVNGAVTASSTALQTANNINLSVNSGYKNYIVSPLAIAAPPYNNAATTYLSTFDSGDLGTVLQAKYDTNSSANVSPHLVSFTIDNSYANLTGHPVTMFMLVRCNEVGNFDYNGYHAFIRFGWKDGTSDGHFMLTVKATAKDTEPYVEQTNRYGTTLNVGVIKMGDSPFYLCYRTFTPSSNWGSPSNRQYTINSVQGSWLVHSVGIVNGTNPPTITSLIDNSGMKSAGIDITSGKIELIAGKTQFKSTADNDATKIVVSPGSNTGEGPCLVGKQNNNNTFILESYNNSDAGGVLTVQSNDGYTVKVRPQVIVMTSPNCNVHIDTHTGYLLIRTGDKGIQLQPGSGNVNSNNPSRIIISNLRRYASSADPLPSPGELYYDGNGVVHYERGDSLAPELDEDLTGDSDTTGTEGSDAPALDLDLTGEVDESTGENTPTNEETTTDGEE